MLHGQHLPDFSTFPVFSVKKKKKRPWFHLKGFLMEMQQGSNVMDNSIYI